MIGQRAASIFVGLLVCLAGAALLAQDPAAPGLVAHSGSKVFHLSTCPAAAKIPAKSKVELLSLDEAKLQRYKPCPSCKPAAPPAPKDDEEPDSDMPATKTKGKAKPGDDAGMPKGKARKGRGSAKKAEPPAKDEGKPEPADGKMKFSAEVAPILVGNCVRCHNPQQKRGGFDMTTFQKLMGGSAKRKVIVPGKPDESELVLRIRGEAEGQKMPPGQNDLAPETIAKIEEWIKAGAILDKGYEPTASLDSIAPTPEARRRAAAAKLSPEERDKKLQDVAMERWKMASAKSTPEMTSGKNFLLFSNLPKERAEALLKTMEAQRMAVGSLLGAAAEVSLGGPEKVSLYVFNDLAAYVEFVRSIENREVEQGVEAHGRLDVEQPYLAAADPLGGGPEAAPAKRPARSKKGPDSADDADAPSRTLAGLLAEQLGAAAVSAGGKPPRWLSYGLGAWVGSRVDPPGSPYYRKLRDEAYAQQLQGWETKANEALGDQGDPETLRAIGLSLCEWQASTLRAQYPYFVRGLVSEGGGALDDVIRGCFGDMTTRAQFLEQWGGFVAARYGRRR